MVANEKKGGRKEEGRREEGGRKDEGRRKEEEGRKEERGRRKEVTQPTRNLTTLTSQVGNEQDAIIFLVKRQTISNKKLRYTPRQVVNGCRGGHHVRACRCQQVDATLPPPFPLDKFILPFCPFCLSFWPHGFSGNDCGDIRPDRSCTFFSPHQYVNMRSALLPPLHFWSACAHAPLAMESVVRQCHF